MKPCPSGADFPHFPPPVWLQICVPNLPRAAWTGVILDAGWDMVFASWLCVENLASTLLSGGETIRFQHQVWVFFF